MDINVIAASGRFQPKLTGWNFAESTSLKVTMAGTFPAFSASGSVQLTTLPRPTTLLVSAARGGVVRQLADVNIGVSTTLVINGKPKFPAFGVSASANVPLGLRGDASFGKFKTAGQVTVPRGVRGATTFPRFGFKGLGIVPPIEVKKGGTFPGFTAKGLVGIPYLATSQFSFGRFSARSAVAQQFLVSGGDAFPALAMQGFGGLDYSTKLSGDAGFPSFGLGGLINSGIQKPVYRKGGFRTTDAEGKVVALFTEIAGQNEHALTGVRYQFGPIALAQAASIDLTLFKYVKLQVIGLAAGDTLRVAMSPDNSNWFQQSMKASDWSKADVIVSDGIYELYGGAHLRWTKTGTGAVPMVLVRASSRYAAPGTTAMVDPKPEVQPGATQPVILTQPTFVTDENKALVISLTATKPCSWAKLGGADAALFTLSGSTLTLAAQDFEAPADSNKDGFYVVTVSATDAQGYESDPLTITVQVLNANDTAPTTMTFDPIVDVMPDTLQTSNTVTVAGLGYTDAVTATLEGTPTSRISKNGGAFQTGPVTLSNGDTVAVRHSSAASFAAVAITRLVMGSKTAEFTSTTINRLQADSTLVTADSVRHTADME